MAGLDGDVPCDHLPVRDLNSDDMIALDQP
jgi:hypothetical protein